MDHNLLVLSLELAALAIFVALGIWRIHKARQSQPEADRGTHYDMRRDGQRVTA